MALYVKNIDDDSLKKLHRVAKQRGKTMAQFIRDWIRGLREVKQ